MLIVILTQQQRTEILKRLQSTKHLQKVIFMSISVDIKLKLLNLLIIVLLTAYNVHIYSKIIII